MGLRLPRFYAILDAAQVGECSLSKVSGELLRAGVRWIQYRDKEATAKDLYANARRLAAQVRAAGGTFLVNDRADIALAAGADGVHVGQDDLLPELARKVVGPKRIVGFSTHSVAQIIEADQSSADYIAFGPVFATSSKDKPDPVVGLEGVRRARESTRKPLVAIGGITLERASEVIASGADSVAVIADLLRASNVGARARAFLDKLEN